MTSTMVEPEWDEQTRSAAMALDLYESSLCPLCGRPSWICQASDAAFHADLPTRCHATTALLIAQERDDRDQPQALLWAALEGAPTITEETPNV